MYDYAIKSSEAKEWLLNFSQHVRDRDIDSGLKFFVDNVDAFGTRVIRVQSLSALAEGQWRPTWYRTAEFRFIDESIKILLSGDAMQAVVLALWQSIGVDSAEAWVTQKPKLREGRCTIVLTKEPDGKLVAEHTHFSMYPRETSTAID